MNSILETLKETALGFWISMQTYLPRIVGALIVLIAGYIIAKLVTKAVAKALKAIKLNDITEKFGLDELLEKMGIKDGMEGTITKVVNWVIMLIIIITAIEILEVEMLSAFVASIISFMPKLFSAILIFITGYVIAKKIYNVIYNMTQSLGSGAGKIIASALFYFILILVSITALNQTGIDTSLISNNIILIIGVMLLAGGIAYAYAAKDIMANMLSSFFSKSSFSVGQKIQLDNIEGTIIKIDKISITLMSNNQKIIIPATELLNNRVVIIEDHEETES